MAGAVGFAAQAAVIHTLRDHMAYAAENSWDERVALLVEEYKRVAGEGCGRKAAPLGRKMGATR